MVLTQNGPKILDLAKLIYRYTFALWTVRSTVSGAINNFYEIYDKTFENTTEFVRSLDLKYDLNSSIRQNLTEKGISGNFLHELVAGATRATYTQNTDIHTLAGAVSIFKTNYLQVEGGNWKIASAFIENSKATLRTNSTVTKVVKQAKGYQVHFENETKLTEKRVFDYVVLATPEQLSFIEINSLSNEVLESVRSVKYHQMCTLIVEGEINNRYFLQDTVPELVLTTENPHDFFSFSKLDTKRNNIYKIFAPDCRGDTFLGKLFKRGYKTLNTQFWNAYPKMVPRTEFPPVVLDPKGIYYLPALESIVSVMEMELISAQNIARLIARKVVAATGSAQDKTTKNSDL